MRLNQFNKLNLNPFLAPADTTVDGSDTTVNDIIELMGEDDVPDDSKKVEVEGDLLNEKDKPKDKSDDSGDGKKESGEEDKGELELDEGSEEDEDLKYVPHVNKREILKKYPELFKEFPSLERAYFKSSQYEEVFPTVPEAREALDTIEQYSNFQKDLLTGSTEQVLKAVKSSDEKAFGKIVDGYLETLNKVDQGAYFHVIGNVAKNTIVAMVREADASKNDNLKAAAVILNQFLFGKSEFIPPSTFSRTSQSPEVDEEKNKLQDERKQFLQDRFDSALSDLDGKTSNIIKSTIANHMDPKGVMTDYVRNTAIKEALSEVNEIMSQDSRYGRIRDSLWQKAINSNFSRQSLDAIKTAHLNTAKTLLRDVIQRHRNAALKGSGKRVSSEREEPTRKGPITVGRSSQSSSSQASEKGIKKGEKTLDFFMRD